LLPLPPPPQITPMILNNRNWVGFPQNVQWLQIPGSIFVHRSALFTECCTCFRQSVNESIRIILKNKPRLLPNSVIFCSHLRIHSILYMLYATWKAWGRNACQYIVWQQTGQEGLDLLQWKGFLPSPQSPHRLLGPTQTPSRCVMRTLLKPGARETVTYIQYWKRVEFNFHCRLVVWWLSTATTWQFMWEGVGTKAKSECTSKFEKQYNFCTVALSGYFARK
jgi:hypothetical protein